MLITHEREKLIQAIIFFVQNTRNCGKVKLFKLLYFLDFEHFKDTGRSVTGLDYSAWPMGPVPVDLVAEIDLPQPDMAASMTFTQKPIRNGRQVMLDVTPNIEFSDQNFTRREMRLMHRLAEEYADALADDMVEATHLENMPWDKVYNQQGAKQQRIPYELALRSQEAETLLQVARERKELLEQLR
ncbi:TPA: Panacea domain-containing protein [Pseudomonas aeruginosa]|uniref:Panacea domain-containing protein n=1 Tax=Pseudomonas aeruginosa TaxID=287 RepID=UPI0009370C19|nr:Panacea domain-containing protein [Pseudomonas aeruginosa]MBV5520105.1 SocA family protein [Pseudomonas aeruginosa]MCF1244070.1 SocA family protein [Pseudomonas aeruginosa]MCS7523272.1 Panacea domain-containing protein [Pseudomonas aeruginosa]MCS7616531.1 Panacea domain-containing protein [Pseudomonas aeruginosa]MCS9912551.1 Panacea domain-containing protein [Pseudomonas aeruginosa]